MFNWLTKKPAAAPVAQVSELDQQINARFPPSVLFRVTDEMRAIAGLTNDPGYPAMYEDNAFFEGLLRSYPRPPQYEEEREQREADFWIEYCNTFTVKKPDGSPALKPKQEILDYFIFWEKAIFRHYYAATGIVNKTMVEELCRHSLAARKAHTMKTWGDSDSLSNRQKREEFNSALEKGKRFIEETKPAHFQKWGEWFFFNVVEAFKKQHQSKPPEDRNVHGEGGFATRSDIARAARGQTRGPASEQEFED